MAKIVLCTGIDGEAKRRLLQEIKDEASRLYPNKKVCLYSVGDEMSKIANVPKVRLLDEPSDLRIKEVRKRACKKIFKKIKEEEKQTGENIVALVSTRACYYHRSTPIRSLDDTHKSLNPKLCINLIDDIQDITTNMTADNRWETMSIIDFLRWRDFETRDAEEWAKNLGLETYILPVKEPSITLLDLLFSNKKRVYLSFPMTHASEEMKKKKEKFVKKLREQFIVFDPLSIKEYDRAKKDHKILAEKYEKNREQKDKKRVDELERLKRELGNQTVVRDFKLIKQSDAVVVYYTTSEVYVEDPEGERVNLYGQEINIKRDEGIFLSAGVINEMVYATNSKKNTYAIWTSKEEPSPFFSYHCEPLGRLFKGPKAEEEFWKASPKSFIK